LLDHALKIKAENEYMNLIAASFPYYKKTERKRITDMYLEMIQGKKEIDHGKIKRDREKLKKILQGGKINKN
jgi:hypothetical protein